MKQCFILRETIKIYNPSTRASQCNSNIATRERQEEFEVRCQRTSVNPFVFKDGKNVVKDEITDRFLVSFNEITSKVESDWLIEWNDNLYRIIRLQQIEKDGRLRFVEYYAIIQGNKNIERNKWQ